MQLNKKDYALEEKYLKTSLKEIEEQVEALSEELQVEKMSATENRKYIWDNKSDMDSMEISSNLMASEQEFYNIQKKTDYLKKLFRAKINPYFGRINFTDEISKHDIYIGLTNINKNNNNIIYDWRAPISSLFYDYEIGKASYVAPGGIIKGDLTQKRQYKIKNGKIIHIFDNSVNVTDEFLQEVLTNASTNKMKNIVNTIQREQNEVIRDTKSKNLIVQGIAGSGKTSVALHRIAFLLYKLENLSAKNILIFSPNNIFSEYISNVLPELGEANAKETTFSELASNYITKYREIESFTAFVERYYTKKNSNKELVKVKMADQMIEIIDDYVLSLLNKAKFVNDVEIDIETYPKADLTNLFQNRYSRMSLFQRMELIAEHICNNERKSFSKYGQTLVNKLWNNFNISKDMKTLFRELFKFDKFSELYGRELSDAEINEFVNRKVLYYEDSILFIYLQGKLQEFPYSAVIKQVVVDEAQDYSKLQYLILKKIFPRASYTILGDINQNVNPYYKYKSLNELHEILGSTKYSELNKTYRSSPEIIEFSNHILGLDHAVSVRKSNNHLVIMEEEHDIYQQLKEDIINGKKSYKKVAIITKNNEEAEMLYDRLKKDFKELNYLNEYSKEFGHDLVIIPSYLAKGLEFDYVIIYTAKNNKYREEEKNLYYVVVTRAQHQLKIYNQ